MAAAAATKNRGKSFGTLRVVGALCVWLRAIYTALPPPSAAAAAAIVVVAQFIQVTTCQGSCSKQ